VDGDTEIEKDANSLFVQKRSDFTKETKIVNFMKAITLFLQKKIGPLAREVGGVVGSKGATTPC